MMKINSWLQRIKSDITKIEENTASLILDLLHFMDQEDLSVGGYFQKYKYYNSDTVEERANIYLGAIGIFKLIINCETSQGNGKIKIETISKNENKSIRIQKLSNILADEIKQKIRKKNYYNINVMEIEELKLEILDIKKRVIKYVNNYKVMPKSLSITDFFIEIGKEKLLKNKVILPPDNEINFNNIDGLIKLMNEKNVYKIENINGWYLNINKEYCISNSKELRYGHLEDLENSKILFESKNGFVNPYQENEKKEEKNEFFRLLNVELYNGLFNEVKLDFNSGRSWTNDYPCMSILIGPNGTGKTYILSAIEKIFQDLYNKVSKQSINQDLYKDSINEKLNRDSNLSLYEKINYKIKYKINDTIFEIEKNDKGLTQFKNKTPIPLEDIQLPKKLLAYSYTVSDKFTFKPNKLSVESSNNEDFYDYLGIRATTNATMSSSVDKILVSNFINTLTDKNLFEVLKKVIEFMELIPSVKFIFNFNEKGRNDYEPYEQDISKIIAQKINEKNVTYKRGKYTIEYDITLGEKFNHDLCHEFKIINKLITKKIIEASSVEIKRTNYYNIGASSSGEKHFLYFILSILSKIKESSLVIIDEPEISLHPNWQYKLVNILKVIFKKYSTSHFIIATHSHFIVSDLDPSFSSISSIIKTVNGISAKAINTGTYGWSAEDILLNIFNLTTTRNYYLAAEVDAILQEISEGKKLNTLNNKLDKLKLIQKDLKEIDPLKFMIDKILERAEDNV